MCNWAIFDRLLDNPEELYLPFSLNFRSIYLPGIHSRVFFPSFFFLLFIKEFVGFILIVITMIGAANKSLIIRGTPPEFDFGESTTLSSGKLGFLKLPVSFDFRRNNNKGLGSGGSEVRSSFLGPIKAMEGSRTTSSSSSSYVNDNVASFPTFHLSGCNSDDNITVNGCNMFPLFAFLFHQLYTLVHVQLSAIFLIFF